MKKYYKALLFGSIGTLVETSEIQRKSFNEATSKNNINSILFSLRKSINRKNFSFIGNSNLVKNLKPNPDIYLLALKKLKLKSTECLAIEDSQESLNSAVNAKIKCIIFPGKFHLNKKFKNAYKKLSKLNKNIIMI